MNEAAFLVKVGPSGSASIAQAVDAHSDALTITVVDVHRQRLEFAFDDAGPLFDLLGLLSRIRSVSVTWKGAEYTARDFRAAWSEHQHQEREAAFWRAYRDAGSVWPVPSEEFLSLAMACGDWDGVEPERPLAAEDQRALLALFAGGAFSPEVVLAAVDALRQDPSLDRAEVQRRLAARFAAPQEFEDVVRHAQSLHVNTRAQEPAPDDLVYVVCRRGKCMTCRRLYLEADGTSSRIFFRGELPASGANAGRDLEDWRPTVPPLHMGCDCMMLTLHPAFLEDEGLPFAQPAQVTRIPSMQHELLLTW